MVTVAEVDSAADGRILTPPHTPPPGSSVTQLSFDLSARSAFQPAQRRTRDACMLPLPAEHKSLVISQHLHQTFLVSEPASLAAVHKPAWPPTSPADTAGTLNFRLHYNMLVSTNMSGDYYRPLVRYPDTCIVQGVVV